MQTRAAVVELFLIALAAFVFAACDSSPSSPTEASGNSVVFGVEILGPRIITPSESVQFQLIAHFSDGSKRDVTNEARWRSSPAAARVFSTSNAGLVVGLEPGEGEVEAWFDVRLALKSVMVMPAGTYRLSGNVSEAGVPSESVVGARVEITTGVGTGMTDETDQYGGFQLYGVSGEIGLRVTKDGYEPAVRTITVADHQMVHGIELTILGRRVTELWSLTTTIVSLEGSACFWTQRVGAKFDNWTLSVERSGAQVRFLYDVHNPHDNTLFVGAVTEQSFSAVSDTSGVVGGAPQT